MEILYFDLIIASNSKSIVLACENDNTIYFNSKTNLWHIILEQLTYN